MLMEKPEEEGYILCVVDATGVGRYHTKAYMVESNDKEFSVIDVDGKELAYYRSPLTVVWEKASGFSS